MVDLSGLAIVYFAFLGGVLGAITGTIVGLVGLFFGWPFFQIAFCFTMAFGVIGFVFGCFAK